MSQSLSHKTRLRAMFMSKEQTIYLLNMCFQCIIYGSFSATYAFINIGLGTKMYSINLILGCLIGCIYAYVNTDLKKKKWVFKHYKVVDLCKTAFYSVIDGAFLLIYFLGDFDPFNDMNQVLGLFFVWNIFFKVVHTIVSVMLPGVGDVFEQSLYRNQIDYQNHSNAEILMSNFGAVGGSVASFLVGDFFKKHPYFIFAAVVFDWLDLWARWQFYFNKKNFETIKRNFARDAVKWDKKLEEYKC